MTGYELALILLGPAMMLLVGVFVYYIAKRESDEFDRKRAKQ